LAFPSRDQRAWQEQISPQKGSGLSQRRTDGAGARLSRHRAISRIMQKLNRIIDSLFCWDWPLLSGLWPSSRVIPTARAPGGSPKAGRSVVIARRQLRCQVQRLLQRGCRSLFSPKGWQSDQSSVFALCLSRHWHERGMLNALLPPLRHSNRSPLLGAQRRPTTEQP